MAPISLKDNRIQDIAEDFVEQLTGFKIWSDDEETKDEFDAASDLGMGSSTPADAQELTLRNATLVHHVTSSPEKGKSWLLEQITSQYWEDYSPNAYEDIANVTLGHCSLSIVWESHQCSQNPFAQTTARQLTETQLVRETLWMLSGVNSSYVYSIHGNKVDVNGNLKVSHLSKESLAILLTKFAAVGAKTHELLSFVGEILSDTGTTRQSDVKPTQTAQAFAATLSNYIKDYKKCLTKLQKDIIDKKCPVTLVNLHDTLKQHHEETFLSIIITIKLSILTDNVLYKKTTPA
ncbi:predicted protein [Nematostella vectensis]|uniref:Gamma-tubulin complex component n=1 Tax=Nematostella vectensis TaxID=45351 RepID=A7T0D3_NEMVE|nr:predicted protein [Nematostella vectensis]|eukprot:XP_001622681.1 predicted protein [Nematostella vectensis]